MSRIPNQLNRHSPVALYYQLKRILLAQIEEGIYREGAQLPSENELAQMYNVSRHVVRQALKALVAEGRIVAYQGAGYFVNRKRIRKVLPRLGSHTVSMADLGRPTNTIVVRHQKARPPAFVAERLLAPGEKHAVLIERLSYLDDEPVCLIVAYYLPKYESVLLTQDLNNKSVYTTLKKHCNLVPERAETVISVAFTDERQSSLLQVSEGTPLLHIESFTWSREDELFEYSSGFYRSDRFELELEKR